MMTVMANPMAILTACLTLTTASTVVTAQVRQEIEFPDLPGLETLACDFHMHTVFSDGSVWPTVRVAEAWRQGLDAIAITDHVEYQPHKDDLPANHNRPHDLAIGSARAHGLLLTRAAEITRSTPPGHFNALFLKDIDPLEVDDFLQVIENANEQGAFVFWNHQGWKGPEKGRWTDVHTTIFENKWLHGMEIAGGGAYFPDAHRWCLEKGLTMLGNTDIHPPDLREKTDAETHRTMTLVFVEDRTLPALEAALRARRTVVWFRDQVIGEREWLEPLLDACLDVQPIHHRNSKHAWFEIRNTCDADVQLERTGKRGPARLTLPARTTSLVRIALARAAPLPELEYTATNFLVAPETGLRFTLND